MHGANHQNRTQEGNQDDRRVWLGSGRNARVAMTGAASLLMFVIVTSSTAVLVVVTVRIR